MKIDLCDATDSFRTTLSKDHAYSEDGGCLTHATTVNSWTREEQEVKGLYKNVHKGF